MLLIQSTNKYHVPERSVLSLVPFIRQTTLTFKDPDDLM